VIISGEDTARTKPDPPNDTRSRRG